MAHIRQSRPDSSLGFVLKTFSLFSLRSEAEKANEPLSVQDTGLDGAFKNMRTGFDDRIVFDGPRLKNHYVAEL